MLKLLVDESCGKKLFLFLGEKGFDVKYAGDIMQRAEDIDILEFAEKENRILITNDKDFGELIFRLGRPSSGILFLRLKLNSPNNRQRYVSFVLDNLADRLPHNFVVVKESGVRIRKL